ncbi:MAG: iron ABC transporter permease [Burkholderiales bacterium]|nr:iron ABC transporter permease [Nitrosomonas sp.]MCP5274663.1 iron ABC transporter permease [Burkholderiales bacterium]
MIPIGVVVSYIFVPVSDIWQHLVENTLPLLLTNTFWLALGVMLGTGVLGVSLAWVTAVYEFPGRRFFTWALLLPLAIPAYVTAFVALGLFDFTGPIQTALRDWLDSDLRWFPDIRSRMGVIIVMTLAFYPYVYLLARNAFISQGKRSLEVAQSLGFTRHAGFYKVALPMARPWIAGGIMLVLMETLADFGTVAVFNYDTFTTAIYKAWFSLFSLPAASQLASLLILIVFVIIVLEQHFRARMRFAETKKSQRADRIVLSGCRKWLVLFYILCVWFLAFLLPIMQLVNWSIDTVTSDFDAQRYFEFLRHSLSLSGLAALITCTVVTMIVYAARRFPGKAMQFAVRTATIGYALPGAVLAIGIFVPLAWLDGKLSDLAYAFLHIETGLLIQGTIIIMLLAYLVRFMAVSHYPINGAMQRVTPSIEEAAMGMGMHGWSMLSRVHLPILKSGIFTGATLVFVDVMKEMPITLMTRPFGWDTLAVRVFEMTSEGQWEQAALPAVTLVLAGLLPIVFFMRQTED